jgi:hypothetical protein
VLGLGFWQNKIRTKVELPKMLVTSTAVGPQRIRSEIFAAAENMRTLYVHLFIPDNNRRLPSPVQTKVVVGQPSRADIPGSLATTTMMESKGEFLRTKAMTGCFEKAGKSRLICRDHREGVANNIGSDGAFKV